MSVQTGLFSREHLEPTTPHRRDHEIVCRGDPMWSPAHDQSALASPRDHGNCTNTVGTGVRSQATGLSMVHEHLAPRSLFAETTGLCILNSHPHPPLRRSPFPCLGKAGILHRRLGALWGWSVQTGLVSGQSGCLRPNAMSLQFEDNPVVSAPWSPRHRRWHITPPQVEYHAALRHITRRRRISRHRR